MKNFFSGKQLNKSVNPDEAIAYGAAVYSAILHGVQSKVLDRLLVLDVIPHSLGVNINGDIMKVVIKRNTTLPTKKTEEFTTVENNQTSISCEVFEKTGVNLADLNILGKFTLNNLPSAPCGALDVQVTFEID